jgi:hypothetical protein
VVHRMGSDSVGPFCKNGLKVKRKSNPKSVI